MYYSSLSKYRNLQFTLKYFNPVSGETIISEFSLVCDRKSLRNTAEMMFLGGVAVGGIVCGWLSDKYGRKKTLIASVTIQAILGNDKTY